MGPLLTWAQFILCHLPQWQLVGVGHFKFPILGLTFWIQESKSVFEFTERMEHVPFLPLLHWTRYLYPQWPAASFSSSPRSVYCVWQPHRPLPPCVKLVFLLSLRGKSWCQCQSSRGFCPPSATFELCGFLCLFVLFWPHRGPISISRHLTLLFLFSRKPFYNDAL